MTVRAAGLTTSPAPDEPAGTGQRRHLGHARREEPNELRGGKVNGLKGDQGRVNGMVTHQGLVNGSGFTNGLTLRGNPFGFVVHSDLRRGIAILALSVVAVLALGVFLGTPPPPRAAFAVDGDFSEWSRVPAYDDPVDVTAGHVDLVSYRVHGATGVLFAYGKTRQPLFPGPIPSSVYVLIDDPDTIGYAAPGLAADLIVELSGWDGALQHARYRVWTGGSDVDNATAFQDRGTLPAVAAGTEFELALDESALDLDPERDIRLTLATRYEEEMDVGTVVGRSLGALLLDQWGLRAVFFGTEPVLELRMTALATDIRVDSIAVSVNGPGAAILPPFPFTIPAGGQRIESVALDASAAPPGSFFTLRVTGVVATALPGGTRVSPTITGDGGRAYAAVLPSGHIVDGMFGEWTNATPDPRDPFSPSIDLRDSSFAVGSSAFFYVRTEGRILDGALLPERRARPIEGAAQSAGPPAKLRREAGEDILRIYMDTDDRESIGQPLGGIVADRLLEVRGRLGRITTRALYAWNTSNWGWDSTAGTLDVAFVGTQLEASAILSSLGPLNNPHVAIAMSDWSGRTDASALLGLRGTRAAPIVIPSHLPSSDFIPAFPLRFMPVVDGYCRTFPGEYDGAAGRGDANMTFRAGRRDDVTFVFICIDVWADVTDDPFWDFAEIMFDTKHDGGMAPRVDDRLFGVYNGDTFLYQFMGDGLGWTDCTWPFPICDPGNAGAGAFPIDHTVFEFMISYLDVWGTYTPDTNQEAGFAVIAFDGSAGVVYWWGSDSVNDSIPQTWGHIIIPEFPFASVAIAMGAGVPVWAWRRGRESPGPKGRTRSAANHK